MNISKENKKSIFVLIFIALIMALLCFLLYKPFIHLVNNPATLKSKLTKLGFLGHIILILAMALQVILVFLPGEIIEVATGFCYGTLIGTIICLLGTIIGTIIIYWFVHKFGTKFISNFFNHDKIHQITFLKREKNLKIILFIIFFIPGTPKDLLTYFAPFTKIKLTSFLLITTIARIPSVITSTIGGNALSKQNYSFTITVFIITGIASIIGLSLYNQYIKHHQRNL